ncbi:hypothetical protein BpHYR1_003683 [Brachionus plicatilis]|uniref:Uncharacterized protein n=1 Tax=Brachionus plicatilis TaxID=10195 RepID=A0A3M7RSC0_BRAPC|nr:hypothetical protein BpHYR1_003683 [Brachionus plicatilis]
MSTMSRLDLISAIPTNCRTRFRLAERVDRVLNRFCSSIWYLVSIWRDMIDRICNQEMKRFIFAFIYYTRFTICFWAIVFSSLVNLLVHIKSSILSYFDCSTLPCYFRKETKLYIKLKTVNIRHRIKKSFVLIRSTRIICSTTSFGNLFCSFTARFVKKFNLSLVGHDNLSQAKSMNTTQSASKTTADSRTPTRGYGNLSQAKSMNTTKSASKTTSDSNPICTQQSSAANFIINKILDGNLRGVSKSVEKNSKTDFRLLFCPVLFNKNHWVLIIHD